MFCDGGGTRGALGDLTVQRVGGLFSKKGETFRSTVFASLLGQTQVSSFQMGPLGTILSRENSIAGTIALQNHSSPRKELPLGSPLSLMLAQAFYCPVTANSTAGKVGDGENTLCKTPILMLWPGWNGSLYLQW